MMMERDNKMLTVGKENGAFLRILLEGVICLFPFATSADSESTEQYFGPAIRARRN